MDQLFMLEVLVDKIVFASLPVPQKKQIVVQATCGNFANLEIRTDVMGALETQERDAKRKDVDIACGKSLVFPINPSALKEALKKCPLEIFVATKLETVPMGASSIPWNEDFIEMVESTQESFGYVSPVYTKQFYPLTKGEQAVGNIEVFVRLSSLGRNIMTQIQIIDAKTDGTAGGPTKQYLFKSTDMATTFQCQKYGIGSETDVMPIAPIYGTADRGGGGVVGATTLGQKSTETIMGRDERQKNYSMQSVTPSVFDVDELKQRYDISSMFKDLANLSTESSIRSIRTRRIQNLFLDIRDLHMDFSTLSTFDREPRPRSEDDTSGSAGSGSEDVSKLDYKTLTVETIEKKLCKHPDCPAARLFKDYGIGPLKKGNGLGGLYKDVEAPIRYGMSHANGTIEGYGPLGRYSRPKKPEDPFIPPNVRASAQSLSKTSGGSDCDKCETDCEPLRLNGGGPISNEGSFPNPVNACQDLMEEFNKLLQDYKNALGPCGQATCPFSQNLMTAACIKVCHPTPETCTEEECDIKTPVERLADAQPVMGDDEIAGCGVVACPYKRDVITPADKDHRKLQSKPGCGSPHCPYVREKLGLEEDEDIHMQAQPCAGKKCPFSMPDQLPPIHWDCPDPLPVGDCKNPNCPLIKKDALLDKYFPKPDSPCHSPNCPFVTIPCTFPGCPFAATDPCPPNCPYNTPVPKELNCTPSICPFAPPKEPDVCNNPHCPYRIRLDEEAANTMPCGHEKSQRSSRVCIDRKDYKDRGDRDPNMCPFKIQAKEPTTCSNTHCPYTQHVREQGENRGGQGRTCEPVKTCEPPVAKTCDHAKTCEFPSCPYIIAHQEGGETFRIPIEKCALKSGEDICQLKSEEDICGLRDGKRRSKSEDASRCNDQTCTERGGDTVCNRCLDEEGGGGKPKKSATGNVEEEVGQDKLDEDGGKKKGGGGGGGGGSGGKKSTPKTQSRSRVHKKGRRRRKKRSGYVYDEGTYYPGMKIGHRECIKPKFMVPHDMGWLWNVHTACMNLRPRRGWKPGAIGRTIAARIDEHRKKFGLKPISPDTKPVFGKKKKHRGGGGGGYDSSSDEEVPPRPTLQVKKKDGVVYVTMNPLKDPKTIEDNENPYMDCSPMQFKIIKNKEKDLKMCYCDDDDDEGNSSSSSELDIEFTPPAGIIHPDRMRKKKNVCHTETQYNINDCPRPDPPLQQEKKKGKKGGKGDKKGKKGKKK